MLDSDILKDSVQIRMALEMIFLYFGGSGVCFSLTKDDNHGILESIARDHRHSKCEEVRGVRRRAGHSLWRRSSTSIGATSRTRLAVRRRILSGDREPKFGIVSSPGVPVSCALSA